MSAREKVGKNTGTRKASSVFVPEVVPRPYRGTSRRYLRSRCVLLICLTGLEAEFRLYHKHCATMNVSK